MSEKKYKDETKNELTPLPQCSEPNQRVHMDLFGPLKTSESGKKYFMCITDAFSKFAELIALPDKQAQQWQKHYSPDGYADMGFHLKSCQIKEKNFAMKLWMTC